MRDSAKIRGLKALLHAVVVVTVTVQAAMTGVVEAGPATAAPIVAAGEQSSACAVDGICITSFVAGTTETVVGASVPLTAVTTADLSATPWYLDIVAEDGTVLMSCGAGNTCTVGVAATEAGSHQYTARLSSSRTAAVGTTAISGSVRVTWVVAGASPSAGQSTTVPASTSTQSTRVSTTTQTPVRPLIVTATATYAPTTATPTASAVGTGTPLPTLPAATSTPTRTAATSTTTRPARPPNAMPSQSPTLERPTQTATSSSTPVQPPAVTVPSGTPSAAAAGPAPRQHNRARAPRGSSGHTEHSRSRAGTMRPGRNLTRRAPMARPSSPVAGRRPARAGRYRERVEGRMGQPRRR